MLITLHFHSSLVKFTDVKEIQLESESPKQLISAIRILFPKLSVLLAKVDSGQLHNVFYFVTKDRKPLPERYFLRDKLPENTQELWVIPTIYGSGKALNFVLGAVLIAVGFAMGPQNSLIGIEGFLTGSSLISTGISMLLSGALSLFSKKPKSAVPDSSERANNDAFGPLQNTTSTDNVLPLNYGLIRASGQFISGYVRTVNHDKTTEIKVSDYV